jgi:chemotaxis protein MotD
MNKLSGTSGQLFSVITEAVKSGGAVRSGKSSGGQATADASFRDLLHSVSNLAKQAMSDQAIDGSLKPGALRARMAQLAETDEPDDEAVSERREAGEEQDSSTKSARLDQPARVEAQSRPTLPSIIGQAFTAVPVLRPQAQTPGGESRAASARPERSSSGRDLPAASAMIAAESGTRPSAESGTHASGAAPLGAMAPQGNPAGPRSVSAGTGFEAVAANIERVAKVSSRDALPGTTKVSVLQQETHLPPVPQLTVTQQVANTVVTELKGSAAPASSAAPDLASAQGNAPDQPLRILTISLEPPSLGNVTVRLRLAGDAVSVHLAADRRDTSQLLEQQRDSLRELMHSAGYVADVAPVQHGSLDGFQAGSGQSQPSLSGQQQSSQGAPDNFSTSSGQAQGEANQARQERHPNQETRHEQDVVPRDPRGAVYL